MAIYKLKDLIQEVISGEWGEEVSDDSTGIKVIRTANFSNIGKLNLEKEIALRKIESDKITKKHLIVGDTIIEKSGGSPDQPVGRVVFFEEEDMYLCNNFTSILRPNKDLVEPKYLMYLLFNLHLQRKVLKFQNKTTGIINLKLDQYLNQMKVDIPSKEIQLKIVNALDTAFRLIEKRQSQIVALDELTQVYFQESLKWGLKSYLLENLMAETKNGMSRRGNDLDGQIVLKLKDVRRNDINYDCVNRIKMTEKELLNYSLENNDLLLIRVNGNPKYVGRCAVFKEISESVYFNDHIIRVRVKNVEPRYLAYYLNSIIGQNEIQKNIKTSAGQYTISKSGLNKIKVKIPEEGVQKDFLKRFDEILAMKNQLLLSLKEYKILHASLLQKAFKGELFQEQV